MVGMLMAHDGEVENGQLKHVPKLTVHSANPSIYKKMTQTIESIERMAHG